VAMLALAGALQFLSRNPTWVRGIVFLAVGTAATFVWVATLLAMDPNLNVHGIYLINRAAVILLLVGAVSSRLVHGIAWCFSGWALGSLATVGAQLTLGLSARIGYGPAVSLLVYIIVILTFVLIRKSQQRLTSTFSTTRIEPARIAGQRELEERAVALLHDTVLNDLSAIAHGRAELDERTCARYQRDIESVTQASAEPKVLNTSAQWLRSEILSVVSDFQWRGLSVEISGDTGIPREPSPKVAEALLGAVHSCLENVVRHSGSESAEIFLDSSETTLTIMIVDQGRGFDVDAVPADRLGIRQSVIHRVEAVGGTVKIWSAAGAGTSVIIVVPLRGHHD
ncbi:MAG: ATP-binding protein, partial [Terrimesophilobacter sp.]